LSDIYIFYYIVNNSDKLNKNLKKVIVNRYEKSVFVKLIYDFKVLKYFYLFEKLYESEKYFYNITFSDNVEVQMKLDGEIGVVVENIYKGGTLFIPDNLFFHTNEKVLAAFSQPGLFLFKRFIYVIHPSFIIFFNTHSITFYPFSFSFGI
jgi:hypothetical protein